MRFQNKRIVITGAGSGFGRATAELCLAEGAHVFAIDVRLDGVGHERFHEFVCDVSDAGAVANAFEGIDRIDGLVTSAGVARRFPLGDQDEDGWDAVMDVNLRGLYLCSKHALARMNRGGAIVHLSSAVALIGVRNRAAYTATKAAIVGLTRNMALDYASRGIRVNCVCPGFARTGLTEAIFNDPARKEKIEAMHPLGRMGEAIDVAKAIVFLLSDDASWITGIAMPVDGGFSAGHQHDI